MLRPMSLPAYRASSRVPRRAGVRLTLQHAASIVADARGIAFFEIDAEEFMTERGVQHLALSRIRHRFPLSLHAADLSIGGEGPLDRAHLARLQRVVALYRPGLFSAGLGSPGRNRADPNAMPLRYDEGSLARAASHIEQAQNVLGLRVLIENPVTPAAFESFMSEVEFLTEIVARTGCGLLLDVNNVHVSAIGTGFAPLDYVERFPVAALGKFVYAERFSTAPTAHRSTSRSGVSTSARSSAAALSRRRSGG